jgi:hypothetical protein
VTPRAAYEAHRRRAEQFGLPFNLSFDEWWQGLQQRRPTVTCRNSGYRTGSTKWAIGVVPWMCRRNVFEPYDEEAEDHEP